MKIELYGNRELLNMGKLELHTVEVHIWKLRWRELETLPGLVECGELFGRNS